MKTESAYKTVFVKKINKVRGWYARRIEDKYGVGIPDIIVGIPYGPTCLIEAKVLGTADKFGPSERQGIELARWVDGAQLDDNRPAYRLSLMLGFTEDAVYIANAAPVVHLENCIKMGPAETPNELIVRIWNRIVTNAH